jgi:hypothetical protein
VIKVLFKPTMASVDSHNKQSGITDPLPSRIWEGNGLGTLAGMSCACTKANQFAGLPTFLELWSTKLSWGVQSKC